MASKRMEQKRKERRLQQKLQTLRHGVKALEQVSDDVAARVEVVVDTEGSLKLTHTFEDSVTGYRQCLNVLGLAAGVIGEYLRQNESPIIVARNAESERELAKVGHGEVLPSGLVVARS